MLRKNNLKNFFLGFIFLLLNVFSFAEIPHSYVTENPKKEVQKVETFKQKEKAELNLTATKIKVKELEGKLVNGKLVFDITDKKDIQEGNILVTQGTPYKSNNARIRSASPTQILKVTKEANKLEVTGENLQDVYVNVLDSKGQLAGIYKNKINLYALRDKYKYATKNLEIDYEYDNSWIFNNTSFNPVEDDDHYGFEFQQVNITNNNHKIKDLNPERFLTRNGSNTWLPSTRYQLIPTGGSATGHCQGVKYLEIDGKRIANGNYNSSEIKLNENLIIQTRSDSNYRNGGDRFQLKLIKFPQEDFSLNFKMMGSYHYVYVGNPSDGNHGSIEKSEWGNLYHFLTINFKYMIRPLKGNSTLTFAEYYPVNEFIQFTTNELLQDYQPLALDNSVRDVTLETTGKGLVAMQQGDKLTVDGHQVVIGAGGNIGPQKLTIGNVKYTYEVKNGKFRIALNEWGVLEPNRTIPINIKRIIKEKEVSITEHNLTIKAPRKLEGTSGVKLNQDYNLGEFIRISGVSLEGAGSLGLENPIPLGVSLASTTGQGIPFMKEGDILEINDNVTKATKSFIIGPNGNLEKQQVVLKSGDVILYTENGKLRVSAINWILNKPIKMNLSLTRGTNKIMDHSLEIQVPDAPFKVTKKGILDFGNVTSGTKRTAETNIGIEMMINDVEIVEFKLKDPNPTMENLTTGDILAVDKIEYLVIKKDDKKYDIRLKGNLTIPEATKSGLYTGSTTMQLKLR